MIDAYGSGFAEQALKRLMSSLRLHSWGEAIRILYNNKCETPILLLSIFQRLAMLAVLLYFNGRFKKRIDRAKRLSSSAHLIFIRLLDT